MNQVFLLTIAKVANKITFVQCFNYEFGEYNCFMPEGKHIWFYNEQEARLWLKENIDPQYLEVEEWESHYKYLKTEKTIQVPIQLLCDLRSKIGSLTNEYPYSDLNRIITEYEESLK